MNWFAKLSSTLKNFFAGFTSNIRGLRDQEKASNIDKTLVSTEQRKIIFRQLITSQVANGWSIELENEFDVVMSKKNSFHWFGKLIIFLILLLVFAPLAIFYLIVVIVKGVNAKPSRVHLKVDEYGEIQPPYYRMYK